MSFLAFASPFLLLFALTAVDGTERVSVWCLAAYWG